MDKQKREKILELVVADYFKGVNLADALESAIDKVNKNDTDRA